MKIKVGEVYETLFGAIVKVIYIDRQNSMVVIEYNRRNGKVIPCSSLFFLSNYNSERCKICRMSKYRRCISKYILKRELSDLEKALLWKEI